MKKGVMIIGCIMMIAASLLVGCSGGSESEGGGSDAATYKIGMALTGPKTDGGWNQTAYTALEEMHTKLGAEIIFNENTKPSDYEKVLRDYAKDGCNLVIGHGYQFTDAAKTVADEFPDVEFLVTSSTVENGKNLSSYANNNAEYGFLQGVFAALMSKTGTVAGVIGEELPQMLTGLKTFEGGATYVNPSIKVITASTGSFDDAGKMKEQTLAMINQGADIVMVNANAAGRGTYEATGEKDKLAIGTITPEYDTYPSLVACGQTFMVKGLVQLVEQGMKDGGLGGKYYLKGVADGVVDLTYNPSYESKIPDDVKQKMDEIKEKMASGEIDATKYQ